MLGVGTIASAGGRHNKYRDRVRRVCGSSLIGYYPLNEASGTVAVDWSGNGRNGAYGGTTGVTLGQPGIGDGLTAASFPGANAFCNLYSAGLASAFSGAEGSLLVWAKVSAAGVWTDGAARYQVGLYADDNNKISLIKSTTNNYISFAYKAGGTTKQVDLNATPTTWQCYALTWSKSADQLKAYVNGQQTGTTQTGLGTWAGALAATATCLGAVTTTPLSPWSGLLAHAALCNRALAPGEMAALYRPT